jgi:hypothetical protein
MAPKNEIPPVLPLLAPAVPPEPPVPTETIKEANDPDVVI